MHGILHRVRVRKLHIACNVVMSQIMYFWRGIYSLSQLQVGKNLMLYEGCPESIQPFWISQEMVAWPWCNLAASQRRPYCTSSMNSHSPMGLVSWQWEAVDWACVMWPLHSQISSLSTAILALGKARTCREPNLGWGGGGWQTKKACMRAVEWASTLSWGSWHARSVILNATVTQCTNSVNGVPPPTDQPHGRVTVHGCAIRSPVTGCQVTSRPRDWFSRYSKWLDTFRTALIHLLCNRLIHWKFNTN